MVDLNALSLPELFVELTGDGSLQRLLAMARDEDLRDIGDVTTDSIVSADVTTEAALTAREAGVVAGLGAAPAVLEAFGASHLDIDVEIADGRACEAGERLAVIRGRLTELLPVERTLLNIVGRLSGIATLTARFVDLAEGTRAVVCETRKTTPGMRSLEKYAVRCGGGTLHRLGLYDAALYKDNHLAHVPPDQLGDALADAARRARAGRDLRFVEVEVDTLEQLRHVVAIESGLVDIVLLDNMPPATLRQAVRMRDEHAPGLRLEASGGVRLDTVRSIAESGVDRISVGGLTHSVMCLDVGLDIA